MTADEEHLLVPDPFSQFTVCRLLFALFFSFTSIAHFFFSAGFGFLFPSSPHLPYLHIFNR